MTECPQCHSDMANCEICNQEYCTGNVESENAHFSKVQYVTETGWTCEDCIRIATKMYKKTKERIFAEIDKENRVT